MYCCVARSCFHLPFPVERFGVCLLQHLGARPNISGTATAKQSAHVVKQDHWSVIGRAGHVFIT